jgi:hypothetical protein
VTSFPTFDFHSDPGRIWSAVKNLSFSTLIFCVCI